MKYDETAYPFLRDDCAELFGTEKGTKIFDEAQKLFEELQVDADYRNSDAIKRHMQCKIFPLIAYYKTLLENEFTSEQALDYARKESAKVANQKKLDNEKLAKMPCTYFLYRLGVKGHMKKNFPAEGWDLEWVELSGKEIHFDMKSCVYHEMTVKHGCPELCTVFCENDDIAFSGLFPKIRFERGGTIGQGAERCDFHFVKVR